MSGTLRIAGTARWERSLIVAKPFEGKVVRKAPVGVFVELEPGMDGLLHVSQLSPGMELDAPELAEGQSIQGWIKETDVENQRIGLTLRRLPDRAALCNLPSGLDRDHDRLRHR